MTNLFKWFRSKCHSDLYAYFNDTKAQLDSANGRQNDVWTVLKDLQARIDNVDARQNDVQATFRDIQVTLKDVLIRLNGIDSRQKDVQTTLKDVLTGLDSTIARQLKVAQNTLDTLFRCIAPTLGLQRCIYPVKIHDEQFKFYDGVLSYSATAVARELNKDCYKLSTISFKSSDIVLDVGANTGIFSIFLAKKYPFLKIISIEPVISSFQNFLDNIKLNNIQDGIITPINAALTGDGRWVDVFYTAVNSGGSNMFARTENSPQICYGGGGKSITLPEIFEKYVSGKIRLLKMDCEGAEYEILRNCPTNVLRQVEHFRGEFHNIDEINDNGDSLLEYVKQHIKDVDVEIHRNMPESL